MVSIVGLHRSEVCVPKVPRFRALTETSELLEDATSVLGRYARSLGGAFYYHLGGVRRALVITDPALLRHVLKDNWENYPKSPFQKRMMGEFLGPGLLTDHGD